MAKVTIKLSNENGAGSCLSSLCVQYMPTYENEIEAVFLLDYTPYKTSTGELRYKLPTVQPSLIWLDIYTWNDINNWID
jgi:hypothetical protein